MSNYLAPGAGKSSFIKHLNCLNRDNQVEEHNEFEEDKRHIQYDLIVGTLKVLECMQLYQNEEETAEERARFNLTQNEINLYEELTEIIDKIQTTGSKLSFLICNF